MEWNRMYIKIGIVLHVDATENIEEKVDFLLQINFIYLNLKANVKWIIITSDEYIGDYFLKLWEEGVLHFVVLHYDLNRNDSYFRIFTSDPQVNSNNCGNDLNFINEQNCDSEMIIDFPKVLRKHHNCTLNYFTFDKFVSEIQIGYAASNFLMNLTVDYLNSKVRYCETNSDLEPFMVVGFFQRFMFHLPSTPVFCSMKSVWVVPQPKRIPLIEVIKVMFQKTVWVAILCSLFIITIVWWLIVKCKNKSNNEILTVPQYERAISSVEELSNSNLRIVINNSTKGYVFVQNDIQNDSRYKKLYQLVQGIEADEFVEEFFSCIKIGECASFLLGSEDYLNNTFLEVGSTVEDNSVTGAFDYVWGFLPKSYVFLTVNKIVYILIESGIIDRFIIKIKSRKYRRNLPDSDEPIPLNVDHTYVIFIFLGAGLGIAVIIFIVEVLKKYYKFFFNLMRSSK
ncbi:hypothetical protein FQR65_LT19967 [Abscondita terminalis]|nr:hypothetical protein FQR65_LT19967 [Abscondita terminalis]